MDSPYSTHPEIWTVNNTRSTKVDSENSMAWQTDNRAGVTSKIGGDILRQERTVDYHGREWYEFHTGRDRDIASKSIYAQGFRKRHVHHNGSKGARA